MKKLLEKKYMIIAAAAAGVLVLTGAILALTGGGKDDKTADSAADTTVSMNGEDSVALGKSEGDKADAGDASSDKNSAGKSEGKEDGGAAASDDAAAPDADGAADSTDAEKDGADETDAADKDVTGNEAAQDDKSGAGEQKDEAKADAKDDAVKDDAKDDAAKDESGKEEQKTEDAADKTEAEKVYIDSVEVKNPDLSNEAEVFAQNAAPAVSNMLMPVASGTKVQKTEKAEIDYSNTGDGYVMVRYTAQSDKRIKAQVKGPKVTHTYNIPVGQSWTTLPLTAGNGSYTITVFQNVTGSKYAAVTSVSTSVSLKDEFAPFLRPNQYVNYEVAPKTVAKAKELTSGVGDTMVKVEKVYNYVVDNLSYDYDLAASVKSGYLPSLDKVLSSKKGICFDYASLMTGMLRSQGIPCRLLIGYAGSQYHAWISVWTAEQGWVDGVIRFNGTSWQRMDPTFASTSHRDQSIMDFIAADTNYVISYQY